MFEMVTNITTFFSKIYEVITTTSIKTITMTTDTFITQTPRSTSVTTLSLMEAPSHTMEVSLAIAPISTESSIVESTSRSFSEYNYFLCYSLTLLIVSSTVSSISQIDPWITMSDGLLSTDLISTLTTSLVEEKQKVSSTILDTIMVFSERKLPTLLTTIPILLSRPTRPLSPARTTTVRSEKSGHILLYSLFGLLSVIICVVTITLSASFIHRCRALRNSDDHDLYTILNHTNTDIATSIDDRTNRLENPSKASLSLPFIPSQKSNIEHRVNMDFKQLFDDNTF